jgi:hypothetical protein
MNPKNSLTAIRYALLNAKTLIEECICTNGYRSKNAIHTCEVADDHLENVRQMTAQFEEAIGLLQLYVPVSRAATVLEFKKTLAKVKGEA